jgi:hypothetical protein
MSVSPMGEEGNLFLSKQITETRKGDASLCVSAIPTAARRQGYFDYNKHLFEYQ